MVVLDWVLGVAGAATAIAVPLALANDDDGKGPTGASIQGNSFCPVASMRMPPLGLQSEVDTLRTVVLHSPGRELDSMLPHPIRSERIVATPGQANPIFFSSTTFSNACYWRKHGVFKSIEAWCGVDGVLEFSDMVTTLAQPGAIERSSRSAAHSKAAAVGAGQGMRIASMNKQISFGCFYRERWGGSFPQSCTKRSLCGDLGAMVSKTLILPVARHPARRGTWLWLGLCEFLPSFSGLTRFDPLVVDKGARFEGGDLLVMDSTTVLIGTGIRPIRGGARDRSLSPRTGVGACLDRGPPENARSDASRYHFTFLGQASVAFLPALVDRGEGLGRSGPQEA